MQNAVATLEANLGKLPAKDLDFANSLLDAAERGLSEKQRYWVERLAKRATGQAESLREDIGGAALIALMDKAAQSLKYPKVKLSAAGRPLVLSRAGARSKTPGALQVTDGGQFGENAWYGRIERDGTFTQGRDCTPEVVKVLRALAADPAATAAAYGQRFGNCCFCRRELTDERSTSVGYGPVCADNFGLPWGSETKAA